ncbi:MAG: imidazole glycerol phosphate synthase subunit HisH [Planctomycetota bacterium]|nr:MAG: imidazole glycerol phosphate synthase subunit HisH [Planctomycetota bacterium]
MPGDSLTVTVVPTGVANLASIVTALRRLGTEVAMSVNPVEIGAASHVVLPGVGSYAAGIRYLDDHDLRGALVERIEADRPTLAVCLGMQMLSRGSEEAPGAAGLGVMNARATRFPGTVRVPQLGWNRVAVGEGATDAAPHCRFVCESGYAYYANSYRLVERPGDGWSCAMSDYAGPFVACAERGSVLACQFHPELSGVWGMALIERWLRLAQTGKEAPTC